MADFRNSPVGSALRNLGGAIGNYDPNAPQAPTATPTPPPDGTTDSVLVQAAQNLQGGQPADLGAGITVDPTQQIPPALRPPPPAGTNPLVQAAANLTGGGGDAAGGYGTPAPMQKGQTDDNGQGMGGGQTGMPGMIGSVEQQVSVQQGTPISPKLQAEYETYFQNQKLQDQKAQKAIGELETLYKDPAFQKAMDDQAKISQQVMKDSAEYGQYLEDLVKMKKDYQASLDKSIGRIDPNKFWSERSTGDKILAGISIFLGGVGAGPNGQNTALKIIDDAIARDINAQEYNIEQAKKEALAKGEILKTEMDVREFIDRKKIERLAIADQVVLSMLNNIKTRQMPLEARQRLEQAIVDREKAALDTKTALFQLGANKVTKSYANKISQQPRDMSKVGELWTSWGVAPNPKSAEVIKATSSTYDKTDGLLTELEKAVEEVGTTAWSRGDKGRALGLATAWSGLMSSIMNSGTLGESEYERYASQSPITADYFDGLKDRDQALALIKEMRRNNDATALSMASSYMPVNAVKFPPNQGRLNQLFREKMRSGYKPPSLGGK